MRRNVINLLLGLFFLAAGAGLSACGGGAENGNIDGNSISGTITVSAKGIGLPDVSLTLFGSGSGNTFTDFNGFYRFSGLPDGTYNILPSKTGYTFLPPLLTVTVNGANLTGQDIIASASAVVTYGISGAITANGIGLSDVTVILSGSGFANTTSNNGFYNFSGLPNGIYTITPSKPGYTFFPSTLSVIINGANVTGKNFGASGTVPATL
jgi:hypothetical protein